MVGSKLTKIVEFVFERFEDSEKLATFAAALSGRSLAENTDSLDPALYFSDLIVTDICSNIILEGF